jgi:hypothetical protein
MAVPRRLSEKSLKVLSLIAAGYSYGQIVDCNPELNYHDIFAAAEEALRLNDTHSDYEARMASIKHEYPRAYERWTQDEDRRLAAMFARGVQIDELAAQLQRQPSAIRSRLEKLGLVSNGEP